MCRLLRLVAFALVATLSIQAFAETKETRVALIIANSHYAAASHLPNPAEDAALLAQTLRDLGFQTVRVENDLTYDGMRGALQTFGAEARQADWALIYYAGHGIELNGANYLVPVDARLKSDRDVPFETVSLDLALGSIESARKLRLVLLDACRNNPFLRSMERLSATRVIERGLAPIEPQGGTLVAYSARAGQVALDGNGQNSPFMLSLAKHIGEPGVEINKLFRLVRDDVLAATDHKQEPFVYGSLPGEDFYFRSSAPSQSEQMVAPDGIGAKPIMPVPHANKPAPNSSAHARPVRLRLPASKPMAAVPRWRREKIAELSRPRLRMRSAPVRPPEAGRCLHVNGQSFCE